MHSTSSPGDISPGNNQSPGRTSKPRRELPCRAFLSENEPKIASLNAPRAKGPTNASSDLNKSYTSFASEQLPRPKILVQILYKNYVFEINLSEKNWGDCRDFLRLSEDLGLTIKLI
ncbi:hypothetical protein VFPPC_16998 [Pochonia chlamydosporia 170]|uniref:Uncharacterized protein n=1 Tax=Pochonia chlamydosporia 170 TaxID=1380566 RepID=A0A179EYR1_METCM|nr:hypothetical protein VFPPC_16998 [Pochonia chlamydosporia 170]OAQ58337.1 hypothetical protein VFPPC_16998 [Pochonia chlamydosporia 170]